MKLRFRTQILVLASYLLLTILFTYPLILNINSTLPSYGKGGDTHSYLWNSWNFKKSFETRPLNPLTTTTLLYPFQPNLTFHTYTLFRNGLVFVFSVFLPFIASFNLVTLLMFLLSGYGAYLLTLRFCHNPYAAFISGMIFSFAPFKLARLMAHYNFVDSAFIPFFLFYLFKAFDKKGVRAPITAGIFLALVGYCSYYYLIFSLAFTTIFFIYMVFRGKFALWPQVLIIALVFVFLFSPILVNIVKHQKDYFVERRVFGASPEPVKLITPAPTSLFNRYITKVDRYGTEKIVFIGFTVLLLTIYSLFLIRKKPDLKFWYFVALIFVVLTLGSSLFFYQFIHSLPILSAARNPSRYIIFTMLALGIISAMAIEDIFSKLKKLKYQKVLKPGISIILVMLVCGEYLTLPVRLFDLSPHEYYQAMAQDPDRYSILEIPFSISGKGKSFGPKERLGLYQYYQTVHNKILPSGWLANLPDKLFDYYRNLDFVHRICFIQEGLLDIPEETWEALAEPDPKFQLFFNAFNIRYILIHRGAVKAEEIEDLSRYFSSQLSGFSNFTLRKHNNIVRFTIMDNILDPGIGENLLLPQRDIGLTEGWANWNQYQGKEGRWAKQDRVVLLFSSPEKRSFTLQLDVQAPDFAKTRSQTIAIFLNNRLISQFTFSGRMEKSITLPAEDIHTGSNVLAFKFSHMTKVKVEKNELYRIGETQVFSPIDISAMSFSKKFPFEGKNVFAGLKIGDQKKRFSLKSGYNIFVLDEETGKLIDTQIFGTNYSPAQAEKMAAYIQGIQGGRIVIALTREDASIFLSDTAVEALRSVGGLYNIRDFSEFCHSLIGVKGASPGEALEMVHPHKAGLEIGQFSNAKKVGAFFHSIIINH